MNKVRIWVEIETPMPWGNIDPDARFRLYPGERLVESGKSEYVPPLPPLLLPKATKPRRKKR